MEVYQATMDDLEEVSKLFNAYRMFYGQTSDVESAREYIRERMENGESVIFIVKNHEEYAGFTQMYPSFSSISLKKTWILNDLFVDPQARRQGVGQLLLHVAKEHAIQTKAKGISLCTAVDNQSAQRLYEKNGYERDSQFYYYGLSIE